MILGFNIEDFMIPCLNKKLFGIDCPGCGIQRSLMHFFRGEFVDAFYMYPAIYTLLLLLIVVFINKKSSFKYGSKIILSLAIINVLIIIVSYSIKMSFIFNT